MSTLRINNIEAKSVPASPTIDEKIKLTNSSGDVLVHVDGKTSGITTIGINTTAGNIKFDSNSNVVVTGIITATKFVGTIEPTNLTVSGDLTISNTAPVLKLVDTDNNSDFSIYGATGVFNIYDETNSASRLTIASDGTITAVQGLVCSSTLTISDSIIHSGDTNTKIRFPAADTVTVELGGSERVRFGSSGEYDDISGSSNAGIIIGSGSFASAGIQIRTSSTGTGRIYFGDNSGNDNGRKDGSILYGQSSRSMQFATAQTERLRIDSSGRVMIGNTDAGSLYAGGNNLVVGSGGASNQGITIYTGNAQQGILAFADGTSGGAQQYAGYMIYDHNTNIMMFATQATERLRIKSNGVVQLKDGILELGSTSGQDNYIYSTNAAGIIYQADENGHRFQTYSSGWKDRLTITDGGDVQIKVDGNNGASSQQGILRFYRTGYSNDMKDSRIVFDTSAGTNNTNNATYSAVIAGTRTASDNGSSDLRFYTCNSNNSYAVAERLRITEDGNVMIGDGTDTSYAPLHVYSENNRGLNAIFGKGFVDNAAYHYDDANIQLNGRDVDGNDTGAGIEFNARNTANSNWLHSAITQDRSGHLNFLTGGSGTDVATPSLTIKSDGDAYFDNQIYFGGLQGSANNDFGRLNVLAGNVYGVSTEHNTNVVLTNEQGSTTQAMVLGDTGGGTNGYALWGVSVNNSTNNPTSGSESGWSEKARVEGNGDFVISGSYTPSGSDDRLKKNKVGITSALTKVCAMEGFTFEWNDVADKIGMSDGERHFGLSAQTVEPLAPEVVVVNDMLVNPDDGTNDYKTIRYDRLVPMLVEAIKDLKTENDDLKSRISALEGS